MQLLARFVGFPNDAVADLPGPGDTVQQWRKGSLVTNPWGFVAFIAKLVPGSNFPYGYNVEPD